MQRVVHHTDADREWAYDRQSHVGGLDKGLDEAAARGWTVVDMKADWKVIFPIEVDVVPEKGIFDELETLGCQRIGRSMVDDGRLCPSPIAGTGFDGVGQSGDGRRGRRSHGAPLPTPPFEGVIGATYKESTAAWPTLPTPPAGAPNVVVILLDDVGFGQTSMFGGPVPTPQLDKLAQQGLRYNNFHTTAICGPSRAALITGRKITTPVLASWQSGRRLSKLQQHHPQGHGDHWRDLARKWLCHVLVRQKPQYPRLGKQRRGTVRPLADRDGL